MWPAASLWSDRPSFCRTCVLSGQSRDLVRTSFPSRLISGGVTAVHKTKTGPSPAVRRDDDPRGRSGENPRVQYTFLQSNHSAAKEVFEQRNAEKGGRISVARRRRRRRVRSGRSHATAVCEGSIVLASASLGGSLLLCVCLLRTISSIVVSPRTGESDGFESGCLALPRPSPDGQTLDECHDNHSRIYRDDDQERDHLPTRCPPRR
jgi:hypothetical protein